MQRQSITTFLINRAFLRSPVFWRNLVDYLEEDDNIAPRMMDMLKEELGLMIGFQELASISGLRCVIVNSMGLRGARKHTILDKERLVAQI